MNLGSEYFWLIFLASLGTIQIAAAYNKLNGLLLFKKPIFSYIFAVLVIGGVFGWFFGGDNRLEVKLLCQGLEGFQQLYHFFFAALAALIFTLIVSSLVNWRLATKRESSSQNSELSSHQPSPPVTAENGLELLKKDNYFQAMKHSFSRQTKR
jgi:hypothetical protein